MGPVELERRMRRIGLSTEALARRAGVVRQTVRNWITGVYDNPHNTTQRCVEQALEAFEREYHEATEGHQ